MVMAWSVDRLGRSLQDLVEFLTNLHALKIDLFLKTQGIDTTTPAGKAMFQMMGVFAEFERAIIQERVRAGLARARADGTKLGRPKTDPIAVLQGVTTAGINVIGMTLLLQFVVSFGFILVVNGPQNMVAYGTDTFAARDFARTGIVLMMIGFALVMLLGASYWRWLGYV